MPNERWNEIYLDGVHLDDVHSGDVSFVADKLREAIVKGGDWVSIPTSRGTRYELHIGVGASVVVRYRDA